jgi:hypothetical protein
MGMDMLSRYASHEDDFLTAYALAPVGRVASAEAAGENGTDGWFLYLFEMCKNGGVDIDVVLEAGDPRHLRVSQPVGDADVEGRRKTTIARQA